MGNIYIGDSNNIARKAEKIYIGDSNGIAREVQKIYVGDENGIAREVYNAYTPPTWPNVYVNNVYVGDENTHLAGSAILLSDLVTPLSKGYTKFRCGIHGEVDEAQHGVLYFGISMNGGNIYLGVGYGSCGSYHNGSPYDPTSDGRDIVLDIATLLSNYGTSGTLQFGYQATDYSGYTPDIRINASMTNIRLTKT